LPLGSFKALLVAYPDTKGYLEKEAESFHDFSHTTIARFEQSRVAYTLVSVLSLTITVSFSASALPFHFRFVLVSFPFCSMQ
jgi:hypothetical protein